MKKKLFSSVLAVMLVAVCAFALTACGGDDSKVSLHGKTYTMGTDVTWSYYLKDANGNKTPIADVAAYIDENWENVKNHLNSNFDTSACEDGQAVLALIKNNLEDPNNETCAVLLKGAVITVSKAKKTGETSLSCSLDCTIADKPLVHADNILVGTGNPWVAHFSNSTISGMSEFELTDYNQKDGSINNLYAKFVVSKGDTYVHYTNVASVEINLSDNNTLVIEGSVNLASVK